jgi:hypothetical protein
MPFCYTPGHFGRGKEAKPERRRPVVRKEAALFVSVLTFFLAYQPGYAQGFS